MATTRVISINEELNQLLKSEDNASKLITQLLQEYYNSIKEKEQMKIEEESNPLILMEKAEFIERKRLVDKEVEETLKEIDNRLEEERIKEILT